MPVPSADNNWKTRVGAYLPTNAAAAFGLVMVFLPGMALFAATTALQIANELAVEHSSYGHPYKDDAIMTKGDRRMNARGRFPDRRFC